MKKVLLLLSSLFLVNGLIAQSSAKRAVSSLTWPVSKTDTRSVLLQEVQPFLALSLSWAGEESPLQIRFSKDGENWEKWKNVKMDAHAENTPEKRVSELMFLDKNIHFYQIASLEPDDQVNKFEVHFFSPGDSEENQMGVIAEEKNSFCPCPLPPYQTRDDWCPAGNCNPVNSPTFTNVTHLIVHHSATPNDASDWAAVVRSFWDFHVNTNGWDDIGYNYLVDPDGVIYEGRGNDVQGAHFSGANGGTMGICVIGNFTNVTPTQAAQEGLHKMLAWKACDRNIDPQGMSLHNSSNLTLNHISGHRDGPLPTACPGDMFYPQLPEVRDATAGYIADNCSSLAPSVLSAEALSTTEIQLNWTDDVNGETGFEIERSKIISSLWQPVATVDANTTTYTDTGLTPDTKYFYRIRAVNDTDTSAYSNEVIIFTVLTSVENLLDASNVQIFPNPVADQLVIDIDYEENGKLKLEWNDLAGKEILQTTEFEKTSQRQQFKLSLGHIPSGVYTLRLELADKTGIFRIVKK